MFSVCVSGFVVHHHTNFVDGVFDVEVAVVVDCDVVDVHHQTNLVVDGLSDDLHHHCEVTVGAVWSLFCAFSTSDEVGLL